MSRHVRLSSGFLLGILTLQVCVHPAHGQEARFETEVNLVLSHVEVRDAGSFVGGLAKDNFVVDDEGVERTLTLLRHGVAGLDVVLLLDEGAARTPMGHSVMEALEAAVESLWDGDRAALVTFGSRTVVVVPFTDDPRALRLGVRAVKRRSHRKVPTGKPFDALRFAARQFPAIDPSLGRRRAILILTANDHKPDPKQEKRVSAELLAAGITVHAILVERFDFRRGYHSWGVLALPVEMHPVPGGPEKVRVGHEKTVPSGWVPRPDREAIDPTVAATGGDVIREGVPMGEAIETALTRLRSSYLIGFHGASASGKPEFRRIRVTLSPGAEQRHPGAIVRHRDGYYTPK
ncbi:MAG: VWA domain-containing protein [Bryobacterales bacterium]|nr:VWA domain-containing protein [Bryobacterales bacterium]